MSVTKAIKGAIKAVARECPALGAHLASSIQTGRFARTLRLARPRQLGRFEPQVQPACQV